MDQKNILVIYYSFEGNTKRMAENISTATKGELLQIKPVSEIKTKGFMKYFWGGKSALMKESPEINSIQIDFEKYDLIFIGTPVWAFTYAPPLKTFFSNHPLEGKDVALFCCHGGGKGKIFAKMRNALQGNRILGEIEFRDPLKSNTELCVEKVRGWAEKIATEAGQI